MQPTQREMESKLVARLLIFVRGYFDLPISGNLEHASLSDYGDESRLDRMTDELCSLMKRLAPDDIKTLTLKPDIGGELNIWWARHQKADKEREEQEANDEKKQKLIKQALSKLSSEEIMALGIHHHKS
jgi:hypothetical protein